MQALQQRRQAGEERRLADVGRRQGPAYDEAGHQQARLVVDHLGRDPPLAGRLLADDLVAAVDAQQRALLAQPRDVRLAVGSDHEVVVRDPACDRLDVDGALRRNPAGAGAGAIAARAAAGPAGAAGAGCETPACRFVASLRTSKIGRPLVPRRPAAVGRTSEHAASSRAGDRVYRMSGRGIRPSHDPSHISPAVRHDSTPVADDSISGVLDFPRPRSPHGVSLHVPPSTPIT